MRLYFKHFKRKH